MLYLFFFSENCSAYYHICIRFQCSPVVLCFFPSMEGNSPWRQHCLWKTCGNFPYVFILFHTKLIFPWMSGDLKKSNRRENICWIQVKIHISDQTSLRICNSVVIKLSYLGWDNYCAGILEQSIGVRNREGIRLSHRPARLYWLVKSIPWNRFLPLATQAALAVQYACLFKFIFTL